MSDADDTGRSDWSAPGSPAPDQQDTTWVEHAPTAPVGPDPETVVLGDQPTLVDPSVPPPPPPAPPIPAWSAPAMPLPGGMAPPPPPPPSAAAPAWGPPSGPAVGQPTWSGAALPGVAGWGAVPVAPKPGVIPLRPLGLGEILDGSISYIRRDPRTVLGISTVIALVVAVVQFVATFAFGSAAFDSILSDAPVDNQATVDQLSGLYGSSILPSLVAGILQVVATGMLTIVMGQAVLGRRVTTREAWARTKPRFWALFGVTLLTGLVVYGTGLGGLAIAIGLGIAVGGAVDPAAGVLLGIGVGLAFGLVAVWLFVKLLVASPVLMLERAGVIESMRRSWRLVSGAWWRTFGIYLLATVLAQIVSTVFSFPLGLLAGVLPFVVGEGSFALVYAASTALAVLLTSIITLPFLAGVTSLLYIDRRIRREALDLELQRAAGTGA